MASVSVFLSWTDTTTAPSLTSSTLVLAYWVTPKRRKFFSRGQAQPKSKSAAILFRATRVTFRREVFRRWSIFSWDSARWVIIKNSFSGDREPSSAR